MQSRSESEASEAYKMKQDDLSLFKDWFTDYWKLFYLPNIKDQRNISFKERHTLNVCKNIIEITRGLSRSDEEMMLAETVALFHDIGRFPQYAKYRTFDDRISVNHGHLGAQILLKEKILQNLPADEQALIIQTVKLHNVFLIPENVRPDIVFFVKLTRDADKLDIWRVFTEYYEDSGEKRASAVSLGLPDTADYSEGVIACIHKREVVPLSKVKALNDFKLMQLSWVYDINFGATFRLLSEKEYIERIIARLPQKDEIKDLSETLMEFINKYGSFSN
ncbi:HD domain-containing protein [Thermodesulfovibrionales bacterium]|nr:HD domain-containing protein [Thermodesulfovibrionales bacterium]